MITQVVPERPGFKIYNTVVEVRDRVIGSYLSSTRWHESRLVCPRSAALEPREMRLRSELLYQLIESSMRLGGHGAILTYANHLARRVLWKSAPRGTLRGS